MDEDDEDFEDLDDDDDEDAFEDEVRSVDELSLFNDPLAD